MKLCIDFETRSRVDLKKCGLDVYARDESTEALCAAFAAGGEEPLLWTPLCKRTTPLAIEDAVSKGWELHAFNAPFEIAIWTHVMHPKHGWPLPDLKQWRCTAARSAMAGLPRSLADCAKAMGLPIEKDDEGKRLMLKLSKYHKPTKNHPEETRGTPEEFERLYEYCRQDVRVERMLGDSLPKIEDDELAMWRLDRIINQRGVPVDLELAEAAVELNEQHEEKLLARLAEITEGEVTTGRQIERIIKWLAGQGVSIPDLTKDSVAKTLEKDLPPAAREVLEIRQGLGQASIGKYQAFIKRAHTSDSRSGSARETSPHRVSELQPGFQGDAAERTAYSRVRESLMFYGAERTGRWAGQGVQMQNIPRGELRADDLPLAADLILGRDAEAAELWWPVPAILTSSIRSVIAAPAGKRLLVCDFAGIEARVLAWLAGQEDLLEHFREGRDVYVEMAAKIFGVDPDDVTKDQRFVGKVAILGLGYGMGPNRFVATCEAFGKPITAELAETTVGVYRETNYEIKRLWWNLEGLCRGAIERDNGKWRRHGSDLAARSKDSWLELRLPSGRILRYREPELRPQEGFQPEITYMGWNSMTRQWERQSTYGGKLVENATQAVARCLLACALKRLHYNGYETVLHVHDEVVVEAADGEGSIEEVEQIMCELPPWADGLPVDVEGFETKRYRK